jgi:hypothetical protein
MSWDEIYRKLEDELGRKPDSGEVQIRILEMLESGMEVTLPPTRYHLDKCKIIPTASIY